MHGQVELIERERKYYLQQNQGDFEGEQWSLQSVTVAVGSTDAPLWL